MSEPGLLALADGTVYRGEAFGASAVVGSRSSAAVREGAAGEGEVVFHTGMTGYQEILTDPSYAGQIVCMTYPEIGNTGVNPDDEESHGLFLQGFVVREYDPFPSSWRARETLHAYLERHGIPALAGIDTRALVRHIRTTGAVNGVLAHGKCDPEALVARARSVASMEGRNLVDDVTCPDRYEWSDGSDWAALQVDAPAHRYRVVAYDFGIKRNILRRLVDCGFDVTVVPSRTSAEDALALEPEGIFLSNGPGDPDAVDYAVQTVRALLGRKPIFGICLGHQILGLALGGRRSKLRFGHHGANQPAHERATGRVLIASENHGFAIDADSLASVPEVEITHINLNDRTVEGLRHRKLPAFSVQYHPEASPGPHDADHLFLRFRDLCAQAHA